MARHLGDFGGAYRIRTGDNGLEGRCVTADTNAPYNRRNMANPAGGLSLLSAKGG